MLAAPLRAGRFQLLVAVVPLKGPVFAVQCLNLERTGSTVETSTGHAHLTRLMDFSHVVVKATYIRHS